MIGFKNKKQSNPNRYFKAKKQSDFSWGKFFKKMFFWLLFLAFWGVCGWVLLFSDYTKIKKVEIISQQVDENKLQEISDNLMTEKWFNYIPKDNFFLFPRKTFTEKIENDFKLVREVEFENKFPNKIKIEIEERQNVAIWCSREKCWLLDEEGELFYLLQPGEKDDRFKEYQIIIDESYSEVEQGQKIESSGLLEFIKTVEELVESQVGLKIKRKVQVPALVSEEVRFEVEGEGWQIYLNLNEEASSQVTLLKEVLESSISSQERENLNYIDLRVSGKAIYNSSFQQSSQD